MLLSDLLGKPVHAPDGERLGSVIDIRFRRRARRGRREGELELIALIVGRHSRMSYYGYERGRVDAPAVIARTVQWMHRDARVIPWEYVALVDDAGVELLDAPPRIPLDPKRPVDDEG